MSKISIFSCLVVIAATGVNAQWQSIPEYIRRDVDSSFTPIMNRTKDILKITKETFEKIQELVTTYEETIHDEMATILNDYYNTRDSAISMQLGINVTDCNQMIQMIEEFASSTDNYFRELIANGVEVGSQHAKYVNARTEKYIKKLSIIKKRTLNCFKNRDDITVLICIHQNVQKKNVIDGSLRDIFMRVFELESLNETLQASLNQAKSEIGLPRFHARTALLIPQAKLCIKDKMDEIRGTKNLTTIIEGATEAITQVTTETPT